MREPKVVLTPEGRREIEQELDHLRRVRREEATDRLRAAREATDSWDSPEYVDAKNEVEFIQSRIKELESLLAIAEPLQPVAGGDVVRLGSKVRVRDDGEEETFVIVGSAEADPIRGKISDESPVGQALLGQRVGAEVVVAVPAGTRHLAILAIE